MESVFLSFFYRFTPSSSGKIPPEVKEKPESAVPKKPRQLDGYVGFANLPNQVRFFFHRTNFEYPWFL